MKDATTLATEMVRDAEQLEEQAKRLRQAAGILDGRRKPRKRRAPRASNSPAVADDVTRLGLDQLP